MSCLLTARSTHRPVCAIAFAILIAVGASAALAETVPEYAPNEVLVRFDGGGSKPARLDSFFARLGLSSPDAVFPQSSQRLRPARAALQGWWKYRLNGPNTPAQVADSLNHVPGITAQPNYLYRPLASELIAQAAAAPNDPEWPNQWGPRIIGLAEIWQQVQQAARESTVVAVIDMGVDYRHEDLASRMWRNAAELSGLPGVDDDGNGYVDDVIGWDFTDAPNLPGRGDYLDRDNDPMDESGHGTNVAGVIAAAIDNGTGIAGIAPTVRVMALRAGADVVFGGGFLEEDDIAAAMAYAVENGARVINMSFGDLVHTPLMYDAVTYAHRQGLVLVAAAGNDCDQVGLFFPAGYNETISVAATSDADARAFFSCYGENLDLAAPGQRIVTLRRGGGTMSNNGTSFAAPHVAGAAAILLSMAPHLTPLDVRSMLRAGVVDLDPPGWDQETGFGRLDLPTLLRVASSPVAQIITPLRPSGADTGTVWSAFVRGAPPMAWTLTYGLGSSPRIWTSLALGMLAGPADTIRGIVTTSSLAETTYVLRLVVSDALGREYEDRTLLVVDHTPPSFLAAPTLRRRWLDAEEHLFLEWTTDDPTQGSLFIWMGSAPAGPAAVEVPLETEATDHLVRLDRGLLGGGSFAVRVRAVNCAGLAAQSDPVVGVVEPFSIDRSGFDVLAKLPLGVLMPGVADFNGNAVPELVIKPSTRAPFDSVSVYELAPTGKPVLLFDSPVPMRPLAAVDIDGDGLGDLIGADQPTPGMSRVKIAAQAAVGLPPRAVWWTGDYLIAPTVGDADLDGRMDMIVLVDTNRAVLRMYETPMPRQLDFVTELVSPIAGMDGRFGIWRVVADVDGNGRPDVVAGTTGGDVVIFPNTGDNAFGTPRVIEGDGDAVRVFGGIDLTGDGRADFAVLRHIDEDQFDLDRKLFQLELYGADVTPLLVREFADPRSEGNGFAVGAIGPSGAHALAIATPPRLYILTPSEGATAGFTWFGEASIPAQPVIANLDGSGGSELVVQGPDSILIMRSITGTRPPASPTGVRVRSYDSVSVEVSWHAVAGLEYRIWLGPNAEHLERVDLLLPTSPTVIPGLATEVPVLVAVQAVNRAQADSIGPLSEPREVVPRPGPRAVSAVLVEANRVLVAFDCRLNLRELAPERFAIVAGGARTVARSFICDRGETRLLIGFPPDAVDLETHPNTVLSYCVSDTGGARRESSIQLTVAGDTDKPGITYALLTETTVLRVAFTHPIDEAGFGPADVSVLPIRSVAQITSIDPERRTFDIRFTDPLAGSASFVIAMANLKTKDGRTFSATAVISEGALALEPLRIVAVMQQSATDLWVVTSQPVYRTDLTREAVLVSPRVVVADVIEGPAPTVLIVKLDPNTPVGPWEEKYEMSIAVVKDGLPIVLRATWRPLADRLYTGHLRAVEVLSRTALQLRFDVLIAPTGHPERPVRVEPGREVTSFSVADSFVAVSLSERTRLGPWGISYFVYVDGLLSVDGQPLSELFAFRIEPPATLDSITVFPQPFRPIEDEVLTLGGLPVGARVRLYTLDGTLVREFPPTDVGGTTWDGRNEAGGYVSSGVFLYVIDSPMGKRVGKLAVVR